MWVIAALLCVSLIGVFAVRHFVVQPFHVPSTSMAPTLGAGEVILVDRTSRASAERGEVVVVDGRGYFAASGAENSGYWVKRVVGTGGDTVQCCSDSGALLLNGVELDEPYLAPSERASAVDFSVQVPSGRLFLLGDNRDASADSRAHLGDPGGGMIPEDRVVGRVTRVVWPVPAWREVGP